MKKIFLLLLSSIVSVIAWAQCGPCTPDQTLPFPPSAFTDGGYLPDPMPAVTRGVAYDTVITFVFPSSYNVPPIGNINVDSVRIDNVSNLPNGFSWETPSPTNTFYPQNSAYGCIRICGTTNDFPGSYNASVIIRGFALGQSQAQGTTVPYQIVAGSVSGGSYTASNITGCDSITSSFEAILDFAPLPTKYLWDFDNGTTDTSKTPADVTYSTPGNYDVTINTYFGRYEITNIIIGGVDADAWHDQPFIECDTRVPPLNTWLCANRYPDLYLRITPNGQSAFETSRTANEDELPPVTTPNVNIPVSLNANNGPFLVEIYDDDAVGEDKLGQFFINNTVVAGSYSFLDGDNFGSYTVVPVYTDTITDTINVVVHETPATPVVENVSTNDSICDGDSLMLYTTASGDFAYTWYLDSLEIVGATDSFLVATEGGMYQVSIVDTLTGCNNLSASKAITVNGLPPVPSISYQTSSDRLATLNGSGYDIQWFFNGVPIPGATSVFYETPQTGGYSIEFTNAGGCKNFSPEFVFNDSMRSTGIWEQGIAINSKVFPNPSEGYFTLEAALPAAAAYSIQVFNLIGKEVYNSTGTNLNAKLLETIDLREQPEGVYMLSIESGSSRTVHKVVVKH